MECHRTVTHPPVKGESCAGKLNHTTPLKVGMKRCGADRDNKTSQASNLVSCDVLEHLSRFEMRIERLISQGSLGRVFEVAIGPPVKKRRLALKLSKDSKRARNELEIVSLINETGHKGLSRLCLPSYHRTFDSMLVTSMPYFEMDLFGYTLSQKKVARKQAQRFTGQIFNGARHLHSLRILHRDIKLENVLLDPVKMEIRLCDFDLSVFVPGDQDDLTISSKQIVGTLPYIAPETLVDRVYSVYSDYWSIGISFFCMSQGMLPWRVASSEDDDFNRFRETSTLSTLEYCDLTSLLSVIVKERRLPKWE